MTRHAKTIPRSGDTAREFLGRESDLTPERCDRRKVYGFLKERDFSDHLEKVPEKEREQHRSTPT